MINLLFLKLLIVPYSYSFNSDNGKKIIHVNKLMFNCFEIVKTFNTKWCKMKWYKMKWYKMKWCNNYIVELLLVERVSTIEIHY